jgi:hypothetical protein
MPQDKVLAKKVLISEQAGTEVAEQALAKALAWVQGKAAGLGAATARVLATIKAQGQVRVNEKNRIGPLRLNL